MGSASHIAKERVSQRAFRRKRRQAREPEQMVFRYSVRTARIKIGECGNSSRESAFSMAAPTRRTPRTKVRSNRPGVLRNRYFGCGHWRCPGPSNWSNQLPLRGHGRRSERSGFPMPASIPFFGRGIPHHA